MKYLKDKKPRAQFIHQQIIFWDFVHQQTFTQSNFHQSETMWGKHEEQKELASSPGSRLSTASPAGRAPLRVFWRGSWRWFWTVRCRGCS